MWREREEGRLAGERVLLCERFEERIENVLKKSRVSSDVSPPSGKTFIQGLHSFSRFIGGAFLFV